MPGQHCLCRPSLHEHAGSDSFSAALAALMGLIMHNHCPACMVRVTGGWRCRSTNIPSLAKDPVLKTLKGFDVRVFSEAPPHVMAGTLRHLRRQYGGVPSYLERACSFPRAEQALLAQHLRPL